MIKAKKFNKGMSQEQIEKFPWGRVLKVHEVGDISIVEYAERKVVSCTICNKETGGRIYHPYVNGEDTSHSFESLYQALIFAVVYKYMGLNQSALVWGIFRAIGIDKQSDSKRRKAA